MNSSSLCEPNLTILKSPWGRRSSHTRAILERGDSESWSDDLDDAWTANFRSTLVRGRLTIDKFSVHQACYHGGSFLESGIETTNLRSRILYSATWSATISMKGVKVAIHQT
ncbi:hypothetical protein AVEN_3219-1 [Araneus ventricosus]|uniref:Uncharacterized protein n=1 Tax=Araneus ventricosus TaxID=182803 RepID=A0A4Y2GAE8_ARAVE|nr:hypothetical protein AVEN_3219-1 [Araneus ventricosus]